MHKIFNLKGIFAVLSRCKSRVFGANFFGGEMVGANFYAFCNYDPNISELKKNCTVPKFEEIGISINLTISIDFDYLFLFLFCCCFIVTH